VGMTLPQIIDCVTVNAAQGLRLAQKGRLAVGFDADFTIFDLQQQGCSFIDSEGVTASGEKQLLPLAAVVAGRWFVTEEGKKQHVFDL